MILLIKLLLVHLLADFLFQPDRWVEEKELRKHKSPKLYLHVLLHGLLSMAIVAEIAFWPYAIAIALSHFLIDWLKLILQKAQTQKIWFFVDQLLHLTFLWIVALGYSGLEIDLSFLNQGKWLLLSTSIVFLSIPASVLIRIFISGWAPNTEDTQKDSLQNAGKYIGILERLFIFIFILTDHWDGIGFLLAAKSIFRFGDLKESKERKLTEYVMIGTLLSFGLAILTGMLVQYLQV
jgi:hypothetical protein